MLNVYEIHCKVYVKKYIKHSKAFSIVRDYIDLTFNLNDTYGKFHESREMKKYVFNSLYPRNIEGYEEDSILTFPIRTSDLNLANLFNNNLAKIETPFLKGLKTTIKKINTNRLIEKIYTLTPVVVTTPEKQYWRNHHELDFFEERLAINTEKKFREIYNINPDNIDKFYNFLEFKYDKPATVLIKTINDRDIFYKADYINLNINTDEKSQTIAWRIIAEGLLEKNSRGFGFLGFKCYE